MKKIFLLFFLIIFITSCGGQKKEESKPTKSSEEIAKEKALQAEVCPMLESIKTSAKSFYASNGYYGSTTRIINWTPTGNPRYRYFYGNDAVGNNDPSLVLGEITPTITETGFKAVAVGNLDDDPDLDIWTIDESGDCTCVQSDI